MRHPLRRLSANPCRGQGTGAHFYFKKIIVLIAFGALAAMDGPAPTQAGPAVPPRPDPGAARVSATVLDAIARSGRAEVVVTLRDGVAPSAPDSVMARAAASAQAAVLASLAPGEFKLVSRPTLLPIVAGTVSGRGLVTLASHPLVAAVERDELYRPLLAPRLAEAVPSVRADVVLARYGISGDGVTVAVLDTGIDNNHPDFEGKILAQHCYASATRSCAPSGTGESDNAQDEYGHGTAVSGIILSPGRVSSPGVAPGADLVAVRVFRDTGTAATRDIISGLDFVMRHQAQYKIRVVNMSLGGGAGRGVNCDDQNVAMKQAFARLMARKVTIFVATGNNGFPDEVSSPACISNSIAVGATYDTEAATGAPYCRSQTNVTPLTIACFTNRGRAMDLLAPGLFISSSRLGGGVTKPGAGTSFAAPMAAGVAALVLEADSSLRPSEVERVLQNTGRPVQHPEDENMTFPLVDALAAIEAIVPSTPEPSATPTLKPATATATTGVPTATATPSPTTGTPGATATAGTSPPEEPLRIYLPVARRS